MKKYTLLLLALAAALILPGCRRSPGATEPTYSIATPPSIAENKTPLEQLNDALAKTKNAVSRTVKYGKISKNGDTEEKLQFSQDISSETAFDWDALHSQIPDFPKNDELLAQFCAYPLRAIPSNDGTICYEITDLTAEELVALMNSSADLEDDLLGTVSITVDAEGCLSRIAYTAEAIGADGKATSSITWYLSVTDMTF